jgi:hypothetical protein
VRAWLVGIVLIAVVSFGAGHATAHFGPRTAVVPLPVEHPTGAHRARRSRGARKRPRVTVIGDSVAAEISYERKAQYLLARGVRLNLQLAACRRLVQTSCTVAGVQPPTVIEVVISLGRSIGRDVVVAVGYNDYGLLYPSDVLHVLNALHRAGVQHVLWLTLRAARHSYVAMNATLREIATTDPELTLVDWNRYSRSHPNWFDSDGIHVTAAGGKAMATLVHRRLVALGIAA